MLVGVGGSGKQSLARLAAFICGCDVLQIAVSSTYGVADFKEALLALYTKAGAKGQPVVFLMTDNQIVKEQFLVYINDLLSTGIVADLFTPQDKDTFINAVRNEVKATGMLDSPENCWKFFIDKVCWSVAPCKERQWPPLPPRHCPHRPWWQSSSLDLRLPACACMSACAGPPLPACGPVLQSCQRQVPHPGAPVPCARQLHLARLVPRLAA